MQQSSQWIEVQGLSFLSQISTEPLSHLSMVHVSTEIVRGGKWQINRFAKAGEVERIGKHTVEERPEVRLLLQIKATGLARSEILVRTTRETLTVDASIVVPEKDIFGTYVLH